MLLQSNLKLFIYLKLELTEFADGRWTGFNAFL